jgi:predicted 3-demethylubiquinone-9 3-methyltransferase (glyoxalase superfamily)
MKTLFASLLALAAAAPLLRHAATPAPSIPDLQPASGELPMQKITTCLWYDDDAEEAVRFYTSIFKDSKVLSETRWGEGGPVPKGTLMTAKFQLAGQEFIAFNAGPMFKFTEAISLMVNCESQAEVDDLWEKLGAGGEYSQCGWLKDKYGLSWQVTPIALMEMMADKDAAKAKRVMDAMLQMGKIDIARLKQAYDQR